MSEARGQGRQLQSGRIKSDQVRSDQRFQQQLELADLDLAVEGVLGAVDDGDGQRALVAVSLEQGDDPGVFDLTLADADLELAGRLPVSRR